MKYASYIIASVGAILLLNIFLSYSSSTYRNFLKDTKSKMMGVTKEEVLADMNKDQIEINSKILNSLDKLNENLENLKKQQATQKVNNNTDSGSTDSGETITEVKNELPEFPGSLMVKLMPKFVPQKIQNNGVFGIKEDKFDGQFEYLTYIDFKKQLKIYVFNKGYGDIETQLKLTNTFKINGTNSFFGYSFFLNPTKKDKKVRFVTSIEAKAVGFEIDTTNYELLKKTLLN